MLTCGPTPRAPRPALILSETQCVVRGLVISVGIAGLAHFPSSPAGSSFCRGPLVQMGRLRLGEERVPGSLSLWAAAACPLSLFLL